MKYEQVLKSDLADKIEELIGVSSKKIREKGIKFSLEHPKAIGISPMQVRKLEVLKSFVSQLNELVFVQEETVLNSSSKAAEYFVNRLNNKFDKECYEVALLNMQNRLIATVVIAEGTLNEAPVYVRELVKTALDHDSKSVILAHNHPGGISRPSDADVRSTRRVKQALEAVGIQVMDHIIVGAGTKESTSLAEKGLL
ncbi:MAG: JAB domain-containing protein [Deltaproteobacteria bacterium]|nr:JAB domain-containing protein [Deltaproteobacteria bacterium]